MSANSGQNQRAGSRKTRTMRNKTAMGIRKEAVAENRLEMCGGVSGLPEFVNRSIDYNEVLGEHF